jgi:uncharacterized phage protein (TIGR02216 family)
VSAVPASAPTLAPFPWQQAIGFGLGVLRLSPDQFWRMTPRELAAAIRAVTGDRSPLTRATFDQLLKRFPDDGSQRR